MTEEQISAELKLAEERVATLKASLATCRSKKTAEQEVSRGTSKFKAALGVGILLILIGGCIFLFGRPKKKSRHVRIGDCVKITKPLYQDFLNYNDGQGRGCDQFNASMVGHSYRIRALVDEKECDEEEGDDPEDCETTYYYRVFGDDCWFYERALEFSSRCPATPQPHTACNDTCCDSQFYHEYWAKGKEWYWLDKWGNGCDWYEKHPSKCMYEGGNSWKACCACGGGIPIGENSTKTAPPEDHKATAPGVVDYKNHVTTFAVMKRMPADGSNEPIAPLVNQSVVIMM